MERAATWHWIGDSVSSTYYGMFWDQAAQDNFFWSHNILGDSWRTAMGSLGVVGDIDIWMPLKTVRNFRSSKTCQFNGWCLSFLIWGFPHLFKGENSLAQNHQCVWHQRSVWLKHVFFLKSRHGTFPFMCCILKKKAFTFPPLALMVPQFFMSQRVEDLRWVSRLEVVCFCFCWFSCLFLHVKKPLAHDYHRHHRVRRWISFNPSCQSYEKPWHRQGPTQCWMPWGAAKWWATDGWMEWFCGEISNTKGLYIFWGFFGGLDGNSTKNLDFTEWFFVVWVNHLGRSKAASFCWLSSWYWYEIVQFNPVTESTPLKINMEPKQCRFGRWFSFSNRWFSRVYLFFRWSFFFGKWVSSPFQTMAFLSQKFLDVGVEMLEKQRNSGFPLSRCLKNKQGNF